MVKLKPEEERRRLVEALQAYGALRSPKVIRAMLKVPREMFVLESMKDRAYDDTPLPILSGQTISAPHMVAMMSELLELEAGHRVLEVGAGSGYHAAVVAEIIAPEEAENKGHVYTVEILPELVRFASENLEKTSYAKVVTVIQGDGSRGLPSHAPFDRIFVTASAPSVPPPLVEQLKPGGILVIPVGGAYISQTLRTVKKRQDGQVESSDLMGVAFVPLRGEYGWKS
ncbi:protein-L-isoaspartate(D-aspartate) O-methyltransferase [Candidatus Hecatella orcuttiae]|jgi:protein-L-isoaspartate(D-aspartate) O-methyltransferase|uniref:protein-L-isoaspartate(D-aspartate) O-methyltransferase n=1 Tax=Candidatus Hecatella orcuttiae TaxID=1935119 RepID=UPI002867E286|nr:protein-L-isoaspartate(D-aspartate) O-methyltransferase [Candidatus Hecatella orcuttiae]